LKQIILDAMQATSVILVFVTLLFGLKYSIIKADIEKEVPGAGEIAKKNEKQRLKSSFIVNCLPQLILFGVSSYIFLPLTVKIIQSSKFDLWNFDVLSTAFVSVVLWVWALFLWSLWLSVKLLLKINSIKKLKH